jgi:hypothetical protein
MEEVKEAKEAAVAHAPWAIGRCGAAVIVIGSDYSSSRRTDGELPGATQLESRLIFSYYFGEEKQRNACRTDHSVAQ